MRYFGISDLKSLEETYRDKINIIFIYISEAHSRDEWPISIIYNPIQHRTIEDRILAANEFKKEFGLNLNIYIDPINENNFEFVYSSWPERGFIIHNNKIEYISYARVNGRMQWKTQIDEWLHRIL